MNKKSVGPYFCSHNNYLISEPQKSVTRHRFYSIFFLIKEQSSNFVKNFVNLILIKSGGLNINYLFIYFYFAHITNTSLTDTKSPRYLMHTRLISLKINGNNFQRNYLSTINLGFFQLENLQFYLQQNVQKILFLYFIDH